MKTRKSTRATARKNTKASAKPAAKRAARPATGRVSAATTVKRTAKRVARKAVAKVAKVAKVARRAVTKSRPAKKGTASAKSRGLPDQASREHVREILGDFSTVMLITSEGSGRAVRLRARPMNVAALADDCTLTFLTSTETAKVDEAQGSPVHVVAQGRTVFLSLSGKAEVVRDRDRIDAAWRPTDQVYFPKGKDDPSICLILFHPDEAELWDVSGAKGLRFLFDAAKSLLKGEKPSRGDGETYDVVDLRTTG
jgi:general stress protein 26